MLSQKTYASDYAGFVLLMTGYLLVRPLATAEPIARRNNTRRKLTR